jgi:hypothetical protein
MGRTHTTHNVLYDAHTATSAFQLAIAPEKSRNARLGSVSANEAQAGLQPSSVGSYWPAGYDLYLLSGF